MTTLYRFTDQREDSYINLYLMGSRWYDQSLGSWISPDTIVPQPGNPQSLNRYSYCRNSPINFTDPSGHTEVISSDGNLRWNSATGSIMIGDAQGSSLALMTLSLLSHGGSARQALGALLDETKLWGIVPLLQFGGIASMRGDRFFAPEFQDDHLYAELWGCETPKSQQLGHFLTAVALGDSMLSLTTQITLIAGHEMRTDAPEGDFPGMVLSTVKQFGAPTDQDIRAFLAAAIADQAGHYAVRDSLLYTIYDPARNGAPQTRLGNSMEDLRLSVRGWQLGRYVASGTLQTKVDVANWIAFNVTSLPHR